MKRNPKFLPSFCPSRRRTGLVEQPEADGGGGSYPRWMLVVVIGAIGVIYSALIDYFRNARTDARIEREVNEAVQETINSIEPIVEREVEEEVQEVKEEER